MSGQTPKKGVYKLKYVSFSSANVSVNLHKFLATDAGKKLVAGTMKVQNNSNKSGTRPASQPKREKIADIEQEVAA